MTSWPTSTTPAPATGPPKPSTAESNTSAAQPLASEIYSTTSPEHSWTPADSEPKYTRFYDEPFKNQILAAFTHGLKDRPETTFGNVKADVLQHFLPGFQRDDFVEVIRDSPWPE